MYVNRYVNANLNEALNGGDDRIRTCEGLLTLNDLANRRFQPLSHVSGVGLRGRFLILAAEQTLSSKGHLREQVLKPEYSLTHLCFAQRIP
jgi:hypothetical protein